ncbi:hypothetical protein BCR41DRAFT_424537 [Lobosporangium transversale]|uniref:Uncharacterized protein n=1 Tax=Lobosporangium transversale TaxID=64571 RepID=A0A1Y2GI61_9FUNG|nr:hypothetical protein BCR41DRAFT_424537 [Lobosporangium transversale]ORZ08237.1 hypothetical protein BCR41DRAFT_424537 [Lobosporangium transversale]|eukprot:XP_021878320.1 hypothetical protein BCR41DRAFT_424537 [Lobosporangium transversale]
MEAWKDFRMDYSYFNASVIHSLVTILLVGNGVKEYGPPMFPHLEFVGWQDEDSIRSFISRIKDQLHDETWQHRIDMLIPPEAISCCTRDSPADLDQSSVSAIEGIISTNNSTKWETILTNTEAMLSSWNNKERRGNIIGVLRHTRAIHVSMVSLGGSTFILEDEALLVEAALGRIKILGGDARVVMDEPLVLRAVQNYFKQKDLLFISAAERIMLTSTNPSVHGNNWK